MDRFMEQAIGGTPTLRLKNMEIKEGLSCKLYAKAEMLNPAGSIKDRVALSMIDDAEQRGVLKKGSVIIEPTSGNTGIAIAAIGAARGYRVIIVMPENMSEARKKIMRVYGAELILTPAELGMSGAVQKAKEVAQNTQESIILGQFDNPANPKAHKKTAEEILCDVGSVDVFVCGVGTGGTLTGIARTLKEKNPLTRIVAVEPAGSPMLSDGKAGPHGLQGIGAGFIPRVLDVSLIDEVITVTEEQAEQARASLAKTEGVFAGISSGAAIYASIVFLSATTKSLLPKPLFFKISPVREVIPLPTSTASIPNE